MSMNPILPLHYFIPDVEARTWKDGRLYLYGSQDIGGHADYCSHAYRVFSTSDMIRWLDHGESFASAGPNARTPWSDAELYAPDCVCKDGTYYLYFCQKGKSEGVAVSDRPAGPFANATTIPGAHLDGIDPAAFVDDDGQAYLYWGQGRCRGARLLPDMRHIDESTLNRSLINEKDHGFHEGASLRKRGDTYYLLFCDSSRGKPTCISYATSRSPLGPFEKDGVIIDNDGCDPGNWNNHGSIGEFKGQWYVFYHRASQASRFSRRLCVEPIRFDANGRIAEVGMTTQGAGGPIPAARNVEAVRACLLSGSVHAQILQDAAIGKGHAECLSGIKPGDIAVYKNIDFASAPTRFRVQAACSVACEIELRIDAADGPVIGRCRIPPSGSGQEWREACCDMKTIDGVHGLYLVFQPEAMPVGNADVCHVLSFSFS